ncbi:alpha-2-macroglobulin [Asaia sp. As-1742]|uniref:alpha-2-macroglobulin family protein n=1 Tax=Asaia sp. As-1742 TaxID=2608325 RepID=UPI001421C9F4|nr:MG2 domain-containing protein [Asaia sp. As-1742]NIE78941.1 alpha-2-macroglobulin family protein [Asaia sp. As-1742]
MTRKFPGIPVRVAVLCAPLLGSVLISVLASGAAFAAPMQFQRSLLNTGGKSPEFCLRFAAPLDSQAGPHYADHVQITPSLRPEISLRNRDLCLGGLAWATRYNVTLTSGMHDARGNVLADPVVVSMATGDRTPSLSLAGEGFILPRHSVAGLDVQTVNIERVRVSVWRLSPAATQNMTSDESYPRVDTGVTSLEGYEFNNLREKRLSQIWTGTMDTPGTRNATTVTAFPIARVIAGKKPGLYLVTAETARTPKSDSRIAAPHTPPRTNDSYDESESLPIAAHWVNVSDMALTIMRGADGLHVFARALSTALPMKGVSIRLVSQGGDDLGQALSDATGGVAFPVGLIKGKGADQPVSLIAMSPTGDYATSSLTQAWFDFSDRGAEGHKAPGPQQAVIATDRGIYRPGETINTTLILRDAQGRALPDLPLDLVLRRPDGVKAQTLHLTPQASGGLVTSLALSAAAAAGNWTLEAYVDPTSPPVGRASVLVQDFVPQTIAVDATPASPFITEGQKLGIAVEGRYLYGAPAAHLRGEGVLRVMRDEAPVAEAKGFVFGLRTQNFSPDQQSLAVPDTDDSGHAALSVLPEIPNGLTLPLKAEIRLSLFDPAGCSVSKILTLPIRRNRPLIGVRVTPPASGGELETRSVPVDVIALSPDSKALANHALKWTVVRENETYDWIRNSQGWHFIRHVIDEPLQNGTLTTDASGRAHFATELDGGRYRVILSDPQSNAASSSRFATGWWSDSTEKPNAPDRLSLTVRDKILPVGGETIVHVQAPFAGEAQIVIATDKVESTKTVTLPKGGLDIPVKAEAGWPGGAYVLVTAYRPLDTPARPHEPSRAVGLGYIGLDQSAHHLKIALEAPAVLRPQGHAVLPLTVTGGRKVHLVVSAVDQGILALTQWKLPDAFDLVYGRRALALDIRDSYAHLMTPVGQGGEIREGGDEGGDGGGGLSVTSTRIVSLFSGIITTDDAGHAAIPLDIPDFEGTLHLMVTAWSDDALGTAESDVLVRDPVFADLTLPRFLAPGDVTDSLVSIVNTEGEAGRYTATLSVTGPIRITGAGHFEANLAKGARQSFRAGLLAGDSGIAHMTIRVQDKSGRPVLTRGWDLQVRPGHLPFTRSVVKPQAPGESYEASADLLAPFEPGSSQVTLGYSGVHGIDTIGLLQTLEAGYGTDSVSLAASARGLLAFKGHDELARLTVPEGADKRINSAIAMLVDREDAGGRFGSWRLNDGRLFPWEQLYVVDFLVHAKEAGYGVPAPALDRALDWLETSQAQSPGDASRDERNSEGAVTPETRAYALYVLARAGRLDIGALRALGDRTTARTSNGVSRIYWGDTAANAAFADALALGHLAGGLSLGNERSMSNTLFGMAVDALGPVRSGRPAPSDPFYWIYLRDLGGLVPLAAESGNKGLAQKLTDRFGQLDVSLSSLPAETTTAMLEAARAMERPDPARGIAVNGKEMPRPIAMPVALAPEPSALQGYRLTNTGTTPLWLTETVTGTPREAPDPVSAGMTLRVSMLTMSGDPYDPGQGHQNDRFIVLVQGEAQDRNAHHCLLTDLLPAGWEIESLVQAHGHGMGRDRDGDEGTDDDDGREASQSGGSMFASLGELTVPHHVAIRDDRLTVAFDIAGGSYRPSDADLLASNAFRLAYIVRAVAPGQFLRPETMVKDRFSPSVMARSASSRIVIAPR